MDRKAQSALEYLMTYGWALIVIAIVIGVLIFVTSGATGGVNCLSSSSGIIVKEVAITKGATGVGLTLQNATGGDITAVSAVGDGVKFGSLGSNNATVTSTTVPKNTTFTVINIDGPANAGTFTNGVVTVSYTTQGGLAAKATITCNGAV